MDFLSWLGLEPLRIRRVVWCRERDSNPHGLPRRILSAMRLPFRHPGRGVHGEF